MTKLFRAAETGRTSCLCTTIVKRQFVFQRLEFSVRLKSKENTKRLKARCRLTSSFRLSSLSIYCSLYYIILFILFLLFILKRKKKRCLLCFSLLSFLFISCNSYFNIYFCHFDILCIILCLQMYLFCVMVKRKVILDCHLRNLSLLHVCRAWSVKFRGYRLMDFEYYSDDRWIGFRDLNFDHVLKSKPRFHISVVESYVDSSGQLTLNL